jgi:hypothetical protein
MFRLNGGVPHCTQPGVEVTPRGGGVLVGGASMGVRATGSASRTMLSERRRPLVFSAPMSLPRIHPFSQYRLLDPGIG